MSKRALRQAGIITMMMAALFVMAQDTGAPSAVPRNFGIDTGGEAYDPRQLGRGFENEYPNWPVSKELPNDVFTFARLRYNSAYYGRTFRGRSGPGRGKWMTDFPDSDLNMSFRLQQLTSLQVNPNGAVVDIDPEQMRHYPFIYAVEVGDIELTDPEAETIRNYLLNGGFMMIDDFHGTREWDNFEVALKQIFPDRQYEEIPLEHEIFHTVFPLKVRPQIPHISRKFDVLENGITWEREKPGSETVHYRGYFDDKRRLCMIICWNTDTGEGWEQEGSDPWYFTEFSEKYAYPMGINVIFYALTH